MQIAFYYRRQGRDFVSGSTRTSDGLWMSTFQQAVADPPDIGAAVEAALDAAAAAPTPERRSSGWTDPMLAVAGVKTNKAWMTGTVAVYVERDGTTYSISPTENDGRGFDDTDEVTVLEHPTTAELGAAVEKYLNDGTKEPT